MKNKEVIYILKTSQDANDEFNYQGVSWPELEAMTEFKKKFKLDNLIDLFTLSTAFMNTEGIEAHVEEFLKGIAGGTDI